MVGVGGDAGLGVAEYVGDDADVDAEGEQGGGGGVPGVVEADGAHLGGGEDGAPFVPVGVFVDGSAVRVAASRFRSHQRSARTSDWRSPTPSASAQRAPLRRLWVADSTARVSSTVRAPPVAGRLAVGASTRLATLRVTRPRCSATRNARARTRCARSTGW